VRAAVYHGRHDLRIEDVAEPDAGPGEVKLRVEYAGICGTDVHEVYDGPIYTRSQPHRVSGVSNPVVLGHELSGVVVAVGDGVTAVSVGDLVSVDPVEACTTCHACTAGRGVFCRDATVHGYTRSSGAFSEFTVVTEPMVYRVPAGITTLQAALIEPMAVGRRAAKRARVSTGDTAAIHGFGPIGLGVAFAMRSFGVRCIIVDPASERRRIATDHGFEVVDPTDVDPADTILDLTDGVGVAASIDAAGVPAAMRTAMRSTAIGGTVVIVAVPSEPVELPNRLLRRAEVWITPSSGSDADDFAETIAAMADGVYPTEGWVETIDFDDIDDGFESLHLAQKVKILIDVAGSV
jgi:(R,R)-butanediol dehydrogenase/meso-butanediol dehydrogenase/diacetyl reductase